MTLPSYTVLPMRATTPPMIAGSIFVASSTVLPGQCRQAFLNRILARIVERQRRRHFRTNDAAEIEQASAVRGAEVRHQDESISIGEQRQQLRDDRRELRLRKQVRDGGALARHRDCGVEQDFFEQTGTA